jgi:ketosteroid isomerase-like protein
MTLRASLPLRRRTVCANSGPVDPKEIARRFLEASDATHEAEFLAVTHPNVVLRPATRPARTFYLGHEGVEDFLTDLHNAVGDYRVVCDDCLDIDDTTVEARGRTLLADGRQVDFVALITVLDGLVIKLETTHRGEPA